MTIPNTTMVDAEKAVPEITFKAFVLGIVLAIILASANAYLGLKAGTTISASIPAAIISMGILRFFRHPNMLENNIVQTAASAGEALVAGMIFILPALLVLHYWKNFHYWTCALLALSGGGFGVLFSIPIRRIMLNDKVLPFPEGVAIGNVLKVSDSASAGMKYLVSGGAVGGIIGFAQDGLQILAGDFLKFFQSGDAIIGYGLGFSPAVFAAGYIVGIRVGVSVLLGIILGWLVVLPIDSHLLNIHHLIAADFYKQTGSTDIRFVGLGVMLVGGFATIFTLIKPLIKGLQQVLADRKQLLEGEGVVERTEKDIPFKYAVLAFFVCVLIDFFVLRHEVLRSLQLSTFYVAFLVVAMVVFIVIASFIFSALCSYFSGLVGATNNPASAMTLASLILCSFVAIIVLGAQLKLLGIAPAALVILTCSVISTNAAIAADNIQDLKAGQMIGATPWKQQLMILIGTVASALVIPFVLSLLFDAYGMGGVFPHPGMDPAESLSSPQSVMMAIVVKAVFAHNLPWNLLLAGLVIAVCCMLINNFLKRYDLGILVMAVGLGIYIPLAATAPIVLGAFLSYLVQRRWNKQKDCSQEFEKKKASCNQRGLMLACGMVAGAALMGVILAVPFAISQSTSVLSIAPKNFESISVGLSIIVMLFIMRWFYRVGTIDKTY